MKYCDELCYDFVMILLIEGMLTCFTDVNQMMNESKS